MSILALQAPADLRDAPAPGTQTKTEDLKSGPEKLVFLTRFRNVTPPQFISSLSVPLMRLIFSQLFNNVSFWIILHRLKRSLFLFFIFKHFLNLYFELSVDSQLLVLFHILSEENMERTNLLKSKNL